nr:unnamed protein product [Callosobruchus chinensis]
MTDVEPKTPNKRKSPFANKNSAKKPRENDNTPKKNQKGFPSPAKANGKQGKGNTPFGNKKSPKAGFNTPQQEKVNATPQKQKTPNLLNGNAKFAQKQNSIAQNKKIKPFPGTAKLQSPKIKTEKPDPDDTGAPNVISKKIKKEKPDSDSGITNQANKSKKFDKSTMGKGNKKSEQNKSNDSKEGKKRRSLYATIKEKVNEGDAEVLSSIREKIQGFLDRQKGGELSKTAKRKLNILQRLEKSLEGKVGPVKAKQVAGVKQVNKPAKNQPVESKKQEKKKQQTKSVPPSKKAKAMVEDQSDEDSDESGEDEGESGDEEESDAELEADDSDEEDEDSDEDDESDDDSPLPPPKKEVNAKITKSKNTVKNSKLPKTEIKIDDLKEEDLLPQKQPVRNKTRFVVFVGNIPFDTKKEDLINHFQGCGEIRHVRIPTEKKGDRPRGFCYVEVADEDSYQVWCFVLFYCFRLSDSGVRYEVIAQKKDSLAPLVVLWYNARCILPAMFFIFL